MGMGRADRQTHIVYITITSYQSTVNSTAYDILGTSDRQTLGTVWVMRTFPCPPPKPAPAHSNKNRVEAIKAKQNYEKARNANLQLN